MRSAARGWVRGFLRLAGVALVAWLLVVALMVALESSLIYFPARELAAECRENPGPLEAR